MMANHDLTLAATYEAMREIGPWLTRALASTETPSLENRVGEIELAVHELAVNIVDHAFDDTTRPTATLSLHMELDGLDLVVRSSDLGGEFNAPPELDLDTPQVRGYGLFIVEQLASSVHYERVEGVNRWTLRFST